MMLSKNEKSRPVAGGPAEVAVSRRESTSGQAESKILHRALKSQIGRASCRERVFNWV